MSKRNYVTTTRGLDMKSFVYNLYEMAKKFGVWNPIDIDLSKDKADWEKLTEDQQRQTLQLVLGFQIGEEAVTIDILPLIHVIANEGRLEEEMFLTTFLFEEAKHTEFFRLFLDEIGQPNDLSAYTGVGSEDSDVFSNILPEVMGKLITDSSPKAVAEASIIYNMFVEGVLAETGYYMFQETIGKLNLMPGLLKGISYIKRDEARHISYGTYLLQRIIIENPELYDHIIKKMHEAFALTQNVYGDGTEEDSAYDYDPIKLQEFAQRQFNVRLEMLARAKGKSSIEELYPPRERRDAEKV